MDKVTGKKVLITGAAMGMGKLYAQYAASEGAQTIVLWDINADALEATAAELRAQCQQVITQVVDVSKYEAIAAAAAEVRAQVGTLDVLINNAGIIRGKYFWEHDPQKDIEMTMAINAMAPMYIAREFLPDMIADASTERRIVNIASAAGLVSNPRMSVYCASKWSCTGWSDSLRLELEQAGYRHLKVLTVNPTYISTGMFEGAKPMLMTPLMTPEFVTTRVWQGMKRGTPRLILPWTVYLSNALKGLLPIRLFDWLADHVFGVYHSMDSFKDNKRG
ncbi:SDR family NAD(P)-dependent oxidoreductase [Solimonas marina]|uniref:SDR family NAD(P)-dependent oxidoreductase n=1 Tax=Solimonas marina TaxID=2714601 RepID=A0A970B543_9GAMM|nr:SDR family NAD(P)-dependent oxidoreductase [Solimonas marina]NKF21308.1 SDR family NAD(P)-dependent oxidoreductase [Solimonas marina]